MRKMESGRRGKGERGGAVVLFGLIVYVQCDRFGVSRCKPVTLGTVGVGFRCKAFKY